MEECNKKPLLVVVGPTASGKTALAVELAKAYNGEVVSADSMQIYKEMDIATAKPTIEEMQGIPHHLISILDNDQSFNVADYAKLAKAKIDDIHARGKLPILAGGTGLYVNAVVDNVDFGEIEFDEKLRSELNKRAEQIGGEALLEELRKVDPQLAATLHPNNTGRIVRGLEVYKTTGKTLTEFKKQSKLVKSPYKILMIGLTCRNRENLYERINKRVDIMLENGLVNEVKYIYSKTKLKTAMQAIGYKELFGYLAGEISLEEAAENLKGKQGVMLNAS